MTLSAAPNPVTEGAETVVTATLSKAPASAVQMEATVTAGTAESGDYTTLASHPLSWSAGSTEASFRIQTNQDDDTGQRDAHRDAGQRARRGGGRRDHLADDHHP